MNQDELNLLKLETQNRQRRKTDLSEYNSSIKQMMDADISLPVMLNWLETKRGERTTLPALRRYIRRQFGNEYYDQFLLRNGWQRTKELA